MKQPAREISEAAAVLGVPEAEVERLERLGEQQAAWDKAHPPPEVADLQIPTSYNTAARQVRDAQAEIMAEYGDLARLPWENLDRLVGMPLPRDLWVIGARPANGKTTFLINLFDTLVRRGWSTMYIGAGSEGPPKDLRRQWSALRCGYPVDLVMENRWSELPGKPIREGGDIEDAQTVVFHDLQNQAVDHHETAHFHEAGEKLTKEALVDAMKYARRQACRYVILDHIHRVRFNAGDDERQSLAETTRWLRDMAAKYDMALFIAAQLHRAPGDKGPLRDLVPPTMDDLKGTGTLEEDAVVGLLLHRTRRAGVTAKDVADVLKNLKPLTEIVEPDTMCVRVGKHRRRGHAKDGTAFLTVGRSLTVRGNPYKPDPQEREPGEDDDLPF